jgi:hypothetical protein
MTLELVIFQLRDGVTTQIFEDACREVTDYLCGCSGFVSRHLYFVDERQRWLDIVYWSDRGSAESAAAQMRLDHRCQVFLKCIDLESIEFFHARLVNEFYSDQSTNKRNAMQNLT